MQLIEVRGKSTRGLQKVYILLTSDMVEGINYLLHTRIYAGIDPKNKYVFGRTSLTPQDGCKAMRITEAEINQVKSFEKIPCNDVSDLPKPVVLEPEEKEIDCLAEKPEQREDQADGLTEEEHGDVVVVYVSTLLENHGSGVKRKRWRAEEEVALAASFRTHLEEKQNVSNEEMRQAVKNYPVLAGCTEAIIRAKISNIILGKDKKIKHF